MPALDSKSPTKHQAAREAYMRQALATEYRKPVAHSSAEAARIFQECCDSALAATDERMARVRVDMWAQAERAHRDLVALSHQTKTETVKRRGKFAPVVDGYVYTRKTKLIDGVRVPVVERV